MKKYAILLTIVVLTACAPATSTRVETPGAPQATNGPEPTSMPAPTFAISATNTPTEKPSPTPSPTAIPQAFQEQLLQTYKTMLLIQIDANLLNETATRVQSGELQGVDSFGAVFAVAALVSGVEEVLPEIIPPEIMQADWNKALQVHEQTKELLSRWFDKEIDSKIVMDEVIGPLKDIEAILSNVEAELSSEYGVDSTELKTVRSEALASFNEIFSTPTPFPEGSTPVLEILSHQGYQDGNWYIVIGEVKNNSDQPMEFAKVITMLYDDNDQVVGTNSSYTSLDVIPPGGKAPFEISTDEWEGTTHYKVQVQGREGELPKQVLEIPSHQSYIDGNWYTIIGEVKNNNDQPMGFVKVIATLYDDNNQVVGTNSAYTHLDVIPPGGKAPFEIATDHWDGATHYEVQVQGREEDLPRQDLEIPSHSIVSEGVYLTIQGEVKNTGSSPAEFVKVIATLYDAEGNVVGIITTYTSLDKIPAGQSSPFEGNTDHWPGFDDYEIQVQGR